MESNPTADDAHQHNPDQNHGDATNNVEIHSVETEGHIYEDPVEKGHCCDEPDYRR